MKTNYINNRSVFLEIIVGLLIILFFYTGLSKLIEQPTFEFDLVNVPVPVLRVLTPFVLHVLPILEMLVALSLIFSRTRHIGLWVSLVLMIIFTIYVGGVLGLAKSKPCTCGGVLRTMTWPQHLVFNIVFTILAALAVYIDRRKEHVSGHLSHS